MLVFPYLFQLPTITGQPWLTATRGRTRIREAVGTRRWRSVRNKSVVGGELGKTPVKMGLPANPAFSRSCEDNLHLQKDLFHQ